MSSLRQLTLTKARGRSPLEWCNRVSISHRSACRRECPAYRLRGPNSDCRTLVIGIAPELVISAGSPLPILAETQPFARCGNSPGAWRGRATSL